MLFFFIDPFRDHFDQYFTPKKQQQSKNNLKPNVVKNKLSNTDLTNLENETQNNLSTSSTNIANKIELRNQQQNVLTPPATDAILDPLGNFFYLFLKIKKTLFCKQCFAKFPFYFLSNNFFFILIFFLNLIYLF